MPYRIRALRPADLPRLVELNNASYPAVPIATAEELEALIDVCSLPIAVVDSESPDLVAGFLLAISPGAPYVSENYRWFEQRGTDSLYVDRIVVGEEYRSQGLGPLLYSAIFERARADGRVEVTCEVNVDPPNPRSLSFHSRLGFERVGLQATKGGTVSVALLAAPVSVLGG